MSFKISDEKDKSKIRIIFGGDLYTKSEVYISKEILELFSRADYAILNLEAPILQNKNKAVKYYKSGPNLMQDDRVIEVLRKLKVKYIGGANNHIADYGEFGIKETKQILTYNNIKYGGFGDNIAEARKPLELIDNKIYVICVGEEEFGIATEARAGYYSLYCNELLEQVKDLKVNNKFVIIFAHGGGEEIPLPSCYIRDQFRRLVDYGADLVIRHHPHVPQGYENYKGKFIFYSLGNFIHHSFKSSVGIILLLNLDIYNYHYSFDVIPIYSTKNIIELYKNKYFISYLNKINEILPDDKKFHSLIQEQALYLYQRSYLKLFQNMFSFKKRIKRIIKNIIRKENLSLLLENEFTIFLLLRNKSHREFIKTALGLTIKEEADLRDSNSRICFNELLNYINKFIH